SMGEACLEEFSLTRYAFKDGKIVSCKDKFGKEVQIGFEELLRKEQTLSQKALENQQRIADIIVKKESEYFVFLMMPDSELLLPVTALLHCGNTTDAERFIASFSQNLKSSIQLEAVCCQAIELGDISLVESLLKARPDLAKDFTDEALAFAAWYGHEDIVKLLLQNGLKSNNKEYYDPKDWRAVRFAAVNGHIEIVRLLLETDQSWKSSRIKQALSDSLLQSAAHYKRGRLLKYLISLQFLENLSAHQLGKLVQTASEKERENKLAACSQRSKSDYLADDEHNSAWCLKIILESAGVPDEVKNTTFWSAVNSSHKEVIRLLLDHGADPNMRGERGRTPLIQVLAYFSDYQNSDERIETAEILLNAGADINAIDAEGKSVVEYATRLGKQPLFEKIMAKAGQGKEMQVKAMMEAATSENFSAMEKIAQMPEFVLAVDALPAFQQCIKSRKLRSIDWFLRKGLTIKDHGIKGLFAITVKSFTQSCNWEYGKADLEFLGRINADPDETDASGATALDYACFIQFSQHNKCIELLQKHGAKESYVMAILDNDVERLRKAINSGKPANLTDAEENTLLHLAARTGKENIVDYLVKKGLKIDQANKDKKTALWLAIENEHLQTAELLLENGASIEARGGNFDQTMLECLVPEASPAVIEFMLKNGANIEPADHRGEKHCVIWRLICNPGFEKKSEVAEILLRYGAQINLPELTGNSLLHRAAEMDWKDDLDWLIEHGANINARNKSGDTPLTSALKLKRLQMADYLRSLGGVE
ncbi:MAG: ankyrin repeat protein, partial [uncultured bacterium]